MRKNLRIAALVGMLAGLTVGLVEAATVARAAHRLPASTVWSLGLVTVGLYAALGWAVFGVLGFVAGAAVGVARRSQALNLCVPLSALGAASVPVVLLLGQPSQEAFRPLWAMAMGVGAAALTWFLAAWLTRRRRSRPVAAGNRARRGWALLLWPIPFLVLVAVLGMRIAFPRARPGAPSVIVITVDALRADRLGCDGSDLGLTPNVDRLARDGVVFENAFSSAPWTAASFGSFLTSRFPSEVGLVRRDRVEDHVRFEGGVFTPQPTLPEILRQAGYITISELSNPQIRHDRGFSRGFVAFRNLDDLLLPGTVSLPRLGRYERWFKRTVIGRIAAALATPALRYRAMPGLDKDDGRRLVRDAEERLARRDSRPVFLWVHLMDVHVPYPARAVSAETRADFPHPPFEITAQFCKDLVYRRIKLSAEGKRYLEAVYNDQVRHADICIGKLLDYLKTQGLYDNAMIIVSADHGEEFWDHGNFEHGRTMYDEVLKVPLVVKFPRNRYGGARLSQLVRLLDLVPTVADVTGIPVPKGVRGRTLVELLNPASQPSRPRQLYADSTLYGEEQSALRTDEYKVIFRTESRTMEVYDLRSDGGEHHNLFADHAVAAALRERLLRLARDSERSSAWWSKYGEKAPPLDRESIKRLRSIGYMAR
jgi:arylsulfatase A-like enzyme